MVVEVVGGLRVSVDGPRNVLKISVVVLVVGPMDELKVCVAMLAVVGVLFN